MSVNDQNSSNKDFEITYKRGSDLQKRLFEVYKSSIDVINQLKISSKKNMEMISNVEEDLGAKTGFDASIRDLHSLIDTFNENITDQIDEFYQALEKLMSCYEELIDFYEAEKGQTTKMIYVRKQINFILALIKKYRYKVNSLQLMGNSMLSHSDEFLESNQLYKSNLITLTSTLHSANNDLSKLLKLIDQKI